jgi:hypothetical protein
VPGSSAKPHAEPPHSVLTIGLVNKEGEPTRAAVDRVIAFLQQRLGHGQNGRCSLPAKGDGNDK